MLQLAHARINAADCRDAEHFSLEATNKQEELETSMQPLGLDPIAIMDMVG